MCVNDWYSNNGYIGQLSGIMINMQIMKSINYPTLVFTAYYRCRLHQNKEHNYNLDYTDTTCINLYCPKIRLLI